MSPNMLILNAPLMANMSTDHLIASLRAEATPFTTTPAEMELLKRLEIAEDALREQPTALIELADEYEFTVDDLRAYCESHEGSFDDMVLMLKVLQTKGIENAEQLVKVLAKCQK